MAVRDIIQAAGGSAATSAATYVEDVFSTYLYSGTGASQTITNGIDLATKGGLVWIKIRDGDYNQCLIDTAQGTSKVLFSNRTDGVTSTTGDVTAFNTTGFTVGTNGRVNQNISISGIGKFTSWTFAKQAKFFDVVTYTGTGSTLNISHNLGCKPGMIIVKRTDDVSNWRVYHSGISLPNESYLHLNTTNAAYTSGGTNIWNVTSTTFQADTYIGLSTSGATYVAYLFADSNSGGFGASGTDSVVACGSFNGTGEINLGWEAQYILAKNTSATGNWFIWDNMRGMCNGVPLSTKELRPNLSDAEAAGYEIYPTANGFYNGSFGNGTYIYLAIRRGPMKTPTDATKVFTPAYGVNLTASSGVIIPAPHVVDFFIQKSYGGGSGFAQNRLVGAQRYLTLNDTSPEVDGGAGTWSLAGQSGVYYDAARDLTARIAWMFRRAPGFFDVVCYTGTGSATTVAHNLGVAPEFLVVKRRNSSENWCVYTASLGTGSTSGTRLDSSDSASFSNINRINATPTSSVFSVGSDSSVNALSDTYVAYLFATCPGVSKVFSYTGNGSSQTINCGFTSGARFVLIKRTDSTGDWYVWDTARGINPGNDPHLSLNTTAAEVTTNDTIDTAGSGFIVNQVAATNVNVNNATYIGLAIA